MAASRVQRWAVFLSGYDFNIRHIKGTENGPADALFRVLTNDINTCKNQIDEANYSFLNFVTDEAEWIDIDIVRNETLKDPVLSQICEFLRQGWPAKINEQLQPFKNRQLELAIENECILWGHRLVIPMSLQVIILKELHEAHMGIVKMKALARSHVWWPGIDKAIKNTVKSCDLCLRFNSDPPRALLHVWKWPDAPNQRIHVDFCGPIEGYMYIVITDAYSKWVDIRELPNNTANTTIKILKEYISIWGLPGTIVTDNRPTFTSEEFKVFLEKNNIKHLRSAPYHPASNGATENAVKTFKTKFKLLSKKLSHHDALYKYLFVYRTTPHCTTGCTPAYLQMGRELKTRLGTLETSVRAKVENNQIKQKLFFKGNRTQEFDIKDSVMAKDVTGNQWRKAEVIDKISPVLYNVKLDDSRIWRRHIDQLRTYEDKFKAPTTFHKEILVPHVAKNTQENLPPVLLSTTPIREKLPITDAQSLEQHNQPPTTDSVIADEPPSIGANSKPATVEPRRSSRVRKAPQRLNL
ncbi:uncharacterized protein K02A2.6-like [Copidosoma floridanum]|uniref:uncharacterized protein K02A2.6-like n=1 Tax=Copidosoma floridanum TaxID=29053 RepID=UPI0006C9436B|nr:uncharacterized protein K02A2.6-like [Copidosoma floridanum]